MRYIFVGNRKFVLEEMLQHKLLISQVFVIANTHLAKNIKDLNIPYKLIQSKNQLLNALALVDFDILVSNGCPYVLPIDEASKKKYINIHPSYLPDLKGIDPVIGSILFRRNAGATCHVMNNIIDGGDIISQVKIPYSADLDVSLLYQLSFVAEKQVFTKALKRNFLPLEKQKESSNLIYYSRCSEDRIITFREGNQELISKIKAFNNKSQGCAFHYRGKEYKVFDIKILDNEYLRQYTLKFDNYQIVFVYEDCIVFKKNKEVIQFFRVFGELSCINVGTYINEY